MASNVRIPVLENFWLKTKDEPDTTLYQDQLGWTIPLKVESGGFTDTHDIWKNIMERSDPNIVGWDLCFFYPTTGIFYFIDQINKELYILPRLINWDGIYIFCSVNIGDQCVPEENVLMDFDNVSEVWDNFKIDGKDMKYILEHSALFLST